MSRDAPSRGALDVSDWQSWWGDVDFRNEESGEIECHFGPVAYVVLADGTARRYQALTMRDLNAQVAHLGIEVECLPEFLDRVECVCNACTRSRDRQTPPDAGGHLAI